jgi:hypothetical protein
VTRRISLPTRKELIEALRLRYRRAAFSDRIKILEEFVALTCSHRKHAIRVLRVRTMPCKNAASAACGTDRFLASAPNAAFSISISK